MRVRSPQSILQQYLPERSVGYCLDLYSRYPFRLKVTKARATKVGDFCAHHGHSPAITINQDLNPYLFLTTFIHEFSHHAVHLIYGNKPKAHGDEWKLAFKTFMGPIMDEDIFPEDIHQALAAHLKNPMASSFSDSSLTQIFRRYDPENSNRVFVSHIKEGEIFLLRGKSFKKGKLRRTRVLCQEIGTGKKYLVPLDLEVTL